MILDPCTWVSEGFLLAIGGFLQEYHLRPSPGGLISSLEGAWVVLDGIKKNRGTSNFPETARMDTPKTEFDARKQQKLTKQLAPYWSFTTQLEFGV